MDKLEELEATIARLQQERDRLKNETLDTNDSTDRPEEATAERRQNTEAQSAETAETANGSNPETPDALSLVLRAESSRQPSLPSQGLQPPEERPAPGPEVGVHARTNGESSPDNHAGPIETSTELSPSQTRGELPVAPSVSSRSSVATGQTSSFDDYRFMRQITDGQWWTNGEDGAPKSFDFGADGYTASVNLGHELLQITTPDSKCGLVYVRGSISNNPDALLARAQRRFGGKSTFGLKVLPSPRPEYRYYLRPTPEDRGFLNFRWPCSEYRLWEDNRESGLCTFFSFVRDKTVYQVIRIQPDDLKSSKPDGKRDSDSLKETGDIPSAAPDNHRPPSRASRGRRDIDKPEPQPIDDFAKNRKLRIRVGGKMRIDCPCQKRYPPPPSRQVSYEYHVVSEGFLLFCYQSEHSKRLEIRLFVDGEKIAMPVPEVRTRGFKDEVDAVFETDINITPGKPKLIVATFALRNDSETVSDLILPTNDELIQDLGVSKTSENATDRLWMEEIGAELDNDYYDLCTGATCLAQILNVTSVPMAMMDYADTGEDSDDSGGESDDSRGNPVRRTSRDPVLKQEVTEAGDDQQGRVTTPGSIESTNPPSPNKLDKTLDQVQRLQPSKDQLLIFEEPPTDQPLVIDNHENSSEKKAILSVSAPKENKTPEEPPMVSATSDSDHSTMARLHRIATSEMQAEDNVKLEPEAEVPDSDDSALGIALLCGILGNQYIDLQRSFWQIRYLVKAHNFLAIQHKPSTTLETSKSPPTMEKEPSMLEEEEAIEKIRTAYLKKIRFHLHHSLVWIANARLKTSSFPSAAVKPFSTGVRDNCFFFINDAEEDRTLYPLIAIWYVMKNCDKALPMSFFKRLGRNLSRLKDQYTLEIDLASTDMDTKLIILLWYFHGCLEHIYRALLEKPGFGDSVKAEEVSELAKKTRAWRRKSEKAMAKARKTVVNSYSDKDESVDRLAFLGIELGLVETEDDKRPSSCSAQARKRILERPYTKVINPGKVPLGQDSSSRLSTCSPWELTCVNHHSRLALWNQPDIEDEDLQQVRQRCIRFLSNFTYICSWDMSRPDTAALWWDLDASCVICATTLDMRSKIIIFDDAKEEDVVTTNKSQKTQPTVASPSSPILRIGTGGLEDNDPAKAKSDGRSKRDAPDEDILELLKRQLDQQEILIRALKTENDAVLDFDWTRCEPNSPLHPETLVQSLDDTPERFQSTQTKNIQLRNELRGYLLRASDRHPEAFDDGLQGVNTDSSNTEQVLAPPEWSIENISAQFQPEEMAYITVYDIGLLLRRGQDGYYTPTRQAGHLFDRLVQYGMPINQPRGLPPLPPNFIPFHSYNYDPRKSYGLDAADKEDLDLMLWLLYLNGPVEENSPEFNLLSESLKKRFRVLPVGAKVAFNDPELRKQTKEAMKTHLLSILNDSLVDINTRYRIFFLQRISPSIVKGFIYMWHPEAIDTFDDHFRDSSNFFDSKQGVWITSITISFWAFKRRQQKDRNIFQEGRDKAPFPPENVALKQEAKGHWWQTAKTQNITAKEIEEGSSSLVFTGDTAGHWWTCSVISSVLSETAMKSLFRPTQDTLTDFIHQPSSGRCLLFLAFLGSLCESLATEYEAILAELTNAIKLGREVLKQGLDWAHAEDAIQRLKSMLWALEALRIFDDRLAESLEKIREAREKMQRYLSQGPGRRHEILERQCQLLLEEFDKRYSRLNSVHVKIEQKIVQISRYREGISAVSNLEDTHTALKQNDTIRILTYITIAYLPLSFVAALFSMSLIANSGWGGKIFGSLLVIFLVLTFILARSLGLIMNTWDKVVNFVMKKVKPPNISESTDGTDDEEDVMEELKPEAKSTSAQPSSSWPKLHLKRRKKDSTLGTGPNTDPETSSMNGSGQKKGSGWKLSGKDVEIKPVNGAVQ